MKEGREEVALDKDDFRRRLFKLVARENKDLISHVSTLFLVRKSKYQKVIKMIRTS